MSIHAIILNKSVVSYYNVSNNNILVDYVEKIYIKNIKIYVWTRQSAETATFKQAPYYFKFFL